MPRCVLEVDLNCGLRDKELRELRWQQIDLIHRKQLIIGKSKTDAGTGRVIPLNEIVLVALEAHAAWYIRRFGECRPEWFVLPAGKGQANDPTHPVTTLRAVWTKVSLRHSRFNNSRAFSGVRVRRPGPKRPVTRHRLKPA